MALTTDDLQKIGELFDERFLLHYRELIHPRFEVLEEKIGENTRNLDKNSDRLDQLDQKIEENTERLDRKIEESTERLDRKIEENTERLDRKIEENTERLDRKIEENTERLDRKIEENTERLDRKIDDFALDSARNFQEAMELNGKYFNDCAQKSEFRNLESRVQSLETSRI